MRSGVIVVGKLTPSKLKIIMCGHPDDYNIPFRRRVSGEVSLCHTERQFMKPSGNT